MFTTTYYYYYYYYYYAHLPTNIDGTPRQMQGSNIDERAFKVAPLNLLGSAVNVSWQVCLWATLNARSSTDYSYYYWLLLLRTATTSTTYYYLLLLLRTATTTYYYGLATISSNCKLRERGRESARARASKREREREREGERERKREREAAKQNFWYKYKLDQFFLLSLYREIRESEFCCFCWIWGGVQFQWKLSYIYQ